MCAHIYEVVNFYNDVVNFNTVNAYSSFVRMRITQTNSIIITLSIMAVCIGNTITFINCVGNSKNINNVHIDNNEHVFGEYCNESFHLPLTNVLGEDLNAWSW